MESLWYWAAVEAFCFEGNTYIGAPESILGHHGLDGHRPQGVCRLMEPKELLVFI